ncbi:protein of unknown function [Kingella kingae]|nr:protein of unknown function [Kingella kingae]
MAILDVICSNSTVSNTHTSTATRASASCHAKEFAVITVVTANGKVRKRINEIRFLNIEICMFER